MSVIQDIEEVDKFERRKADWWTFYKANPHIYDLFDIEVKKCIKKLEKEKLLFIKKIPIRMIFYNIKWKGVTTKNIDGYTINHNHQKMYALQWQKCNPEYAGIFEHRGYIPKNMKDLIKNNENRKLANLRYSRRTKSKAYG